MPTPHDAEAGPTPASRPNPLPSPGSASPAQPSLPTRSTPGVEGPEPSPVEVPIEPVLDLHSFRPAEIRAVVDAYLDACHEHGLREVRLVHGKGIGQLRQTVHALLKKRPDVARFDLAGEAWGGSGATIVQLRPLPPKANSPA